jgi:hypothetical protein
MFINYPFEIMVRPQYVGFLHEWNWWARIVYLKGALYDAPAGAMGAPPGAGPPPGGAPAGSGPPGWPVGSRVQGCCGTDRTFERLQGDTLVVKPAA